MRRINGTKVKMFIQGVQGSCNSWAWAFGRKAGIYGDSQIEQLFHETTLFSQRGRHGSRGYMNWGYMNGGQGRIHEVLGYMRGNAIKCEGVLSN